MGTSAIIRDSVSRGTPAGMAQAPPSPFLGILPPRMWDREKTFFTQPFNFLGLAAGEARPVTVNVDPSRDFVAFYGAYTARKGGAVVNAPPLLVDLSAVQGQGYNPNGEPIDVENLLGTARQPSVWPVPLIVPAGSGIVVRLTNAGTDTLDVRVALAGFEVHNRRVR